jgi:hypothetical protein
MSSGGEIQAPVTDGTPPAGEEIHLPGPTLVPIVNALGITVALLGLILSPLLCVAGAIVFVWSTVRWIRDTRRDIAELPLEHH